MSPDKLFRPVVGLLAGAALCVSIHGARAAPVELGDSGLHRKEDIVVTATRRPEQASRIPISIIAKNRSTLDRDRIESFADLARSTPGLAERGAFGNTGKIAIRGIASNTGAATTGVYINDTPIQTRTLGAAGVFANAYPRIFDLSRVEVLRGPQGTLVGENSEGGLVRFITPDPQLTQTEVYAKSSVSATRGGGPSWSLGQAISLPLLTDVAGLRVSASRNRDGGWINRIPYTGSGQSLFNVNHSNVTTGQAALRLRLYDNLIIQPAIFYELDHANDASTYWDALSDPHHDRFISGQPLRQPTVNMIVVPSLKLEKPVAGLSLIATTSWLSRSTTSTVDYTTHLLEGLTRGMTASLPGVPGYAAPSNFVSRQHTFVQDLRLSSDRHDNAISWIVGVHYANEHQHIRQELVDTQFTALTTTLFGCMPVQCFGAPVLPGDLSYRSNDRSKDRRIAAFASVEWKPLRRVTLTTGIRAEKTTSTVENFQDGPFNFGTTGGRTQVSGKAITPRFVIQYNPNDHDILYASAGRGARAGGGNPGVPLAFCAADLTRLGVALPKSYNGDSVWTYETGVKQHFGSIHLQGSGFLTNWSGIQQSLPLAGCGFSFTSNLGSAVSRGFDLQISGQLTPGLQLLGSLSYVNAHYNKDVRLGGGSVLVSAKDALPVPPWQARISGRYEKDLGDRLLSVQVDYDHASAYESMPAQPAFNADPTIAWARSTDLAGARLGLTLQHWQITVFVDNLLNSHDALFRTHDSPPERIFRSESFRPRTMGLEVTLNGLP